MGLCYSAGVAVTILCFAGLRERAGFAELEYDVPEGTLVSRILDDLVATYPAIGAALPTCLVALNEEYAPEGATVKAGDTIALIPPVSGG